MNTKRRPLGTVAIVVASFAGGLGLATSSDSTPAPQALAATVSATTHPLDSGAFSYRVAPGDVAWSIIVKKFCDGRTSSKAVNDFQWAVGKPPVTLYVGNEIPINLANCPPAPVTPTTSTSSPSTTSTSTTSTSVPATTTPPTTIPVTAPVAPIQAIPSNFNVSTYLRPGTGPIPGSTASEPSGNFRTICNFSHLAYNDPIVYPGQPGASHLHMFVGNTLANASSTYESLRTTGESTCQGGPINRSAYWAPAVLNGAGKVVVPDYAVVYYKGDGSAASIAQTKPLPPGLRMIAGHNMALDDDKQNTHMEWYCEVTQKKRQTIPVECPTSQRIGVALRFPSCWDGRNLDSIDHRSHMAYTLGHDFSGICPDTHPVKLPDFTIAFWFPNDGTAATWKLASDTMPGMTHAPGSTFHSDWFGAWDPDIQALWNQECIVELRSCIDGQLGDGKQLVVQSPSRAGSAKVVNPPTRT